MSAPAPILCAAAGGRERGLGHLMRTAELAREAIARGHPVELAVRGDATAAAVLDRELPGVRRRPWRKPADLIADARWVTFDTRDALAADLSALRAAGRRSLVLDRDDQVDAADWTVLPVLHAVPADHPRVRGGGTWCLVPESVRAAAAPRGVPRDRLVVSFGGADPRGFTERIAAPLAAARERWRGGTPPTLHGVVGPSFPDPERTAACLADAGFVVHRAPSRAALAALFRGAAAAIAGFGTTLQELAWLGVPFLSFVHHPSDVAHATRLERDGIGACGGDGAALTDGDLEALLERSVFDPGFREASAQRGRERVGDGRGAARILDLLEPTP